MRKKEAKQMNSSFVRITSVDSALDAVEGGLITKVAADLAIMNFEMGACFVDIAGPTLTKCGRCEEFKSVRNWDRNYDACEDCAEEMSLDG